jgi:hypothetical protein
VDALRSNTKNKKARETSTKLNHRAWLAPAPKLLNMLGDQPPTVSVANLNKFWDAAQRPFPSHPTNNQTKETSN